MSTIHRRDYIPSVKVLGAVQCTFQGTVTADGEDWVRVMEIVEAASLLGALFVVAAYHIVQFENIGPASFAFQDLGEYIALTCLPRRVHISISWIFGATVSHGRPASNRHHALTKRKHDRQNIQLRRPKC